MLTLQQKHHYDHEGFLVLEDFKSPSEMAAIRERAEAIVDAFNPDTTRSIFTTPDQAMAMDRYFLDSADQVCCFFEEDAFSSACARIWR